MTRAAVWFSALLTTVFIGGPARARTATDEASEAGRVRFQTSCDEAVRAAFDRAVALLHSFEYPESEKSFRAILGASPGCVMAHWGIAMNRWHPLWAPPSRADLAAGAAALKGAVETAPTEREAAYLSAIQAFYDGYETVPHPERAQTSKGATHGGDRRVAAAVPVIHPERDESRCGRQAPC